MSTAIAAALVAACTATSPAHTVALVELYTSQGCSSCPPADRWLSALPQRHAAENVIPLSLHVGYWDYIGWKDPFAKREFNERQRVLAQANRSASVYTPGVFVQGRETPRWSDAKSFESFVRRVNQKPAQATIKLGAQVQGSRVAAQVSADVDKAANKASTSQLFVALTQMGLNTTVTRGENRGETLRNDHVVRAWSGPHTLKQDGTQTVDFDLPAADATQFQLIALVWDAQRAEVLQATALPLKRCFGS